MQQFFLLLAFSLLLAIQAEAQAPQAFQYQAIARDNTGLPITNQNVGLRVSIISGSPTGAILYVETHAPTTNQFGLFSVEIGQGTVANGTFNTITWGSNLHYLKVEMDETGGTAYQDMGTIQLISVPYALHAATADNVDDADANPTNEIQTLSLNGQDLTISGGNTLTLPSGGGGSQVLSKAGSTISLSGGGGSVNLLDDNASNEIQSLSLNGQNLSISGGNTLTLPSGGGTLNDAYNFGGAGAGNTITATSGAVSVTTNSAGGVAVYTASTNTGVGLISTTTNAANTFSAIQAQTNSNSASASAVVGSSSGLAWGVSGQIETIGTAEAAVHGNNLRTNGGHGVFGLGFNGVVGQTDHSTGIAVYGENFDVLTPLGNAIGVAGKGYYGVIGEDRYNGTAGGAYGIYSNGDLGATGVKTFRIDHPQDPENKFLRHFSIESDEVLNVYRGTVTFDANGEATIELPTYFSAINRNVSYQLTPIGAYMPLYVKEKVNGNNQFVVAGGLAGKEVSWSIYAERNDLYLQKNPHHRAVELEKRPQEKGKYLIPSLYDATEEKAIFGNTPSKVAQQPLSIKK